MKKLTVIVSIIILVCIITYGIYEIFLKRTPEKLLKQQFNISLKGFDYTIDSFEEQWLPNGDGYTLVIIKFNMLTQADIDYFKQFDLQSLPVSKADYSQIGPNEIPKQFFKSENGYYIYQAERMANVGALVVALDFKIFIVDIDKKVAVLYYSFI